MLRPALCALALFSVWLSSCPAAAEEADAKPSIDAHASAREVARSRFQEGVVAYDAGNYKQAVDLFLEGERAMHSPAFFFNIGMAYEAMGDSASALRWFRSYLREVPSAEDRSNVEERISALETRLQERGVQQASVLSTPDGATVLIDGRPLGVTPWTGELVPGRHRVAVSLRGHTGVERFIEVQAHRAEDFAFELKMTASAPANAAHAKMAVGTSDGGQERRGADVSLWTIAALGAGGVALGGAVAFELARASAVDEARGAAQIDYRDELDAAEQHQTTARVLAGVGGALVTAGVVLLVLDLNRAPETPSAGLACDGAGCFVSGQGTF